MFTKMTQNRADEDAECFVLHTLTKACLRFDFKPSINQEQNCTSKSFEHSDGRLLLTHTASLGSVIYVTAQIFPGEIIRSMNLTAEQVHSVNFIVRHLIGWLSRGGEYEAIESPHLQGLSADMLRKISACLDRRSFRHFAQVNKKFHEILVGRREANIRHLVI